jgi:hypothetical protein
MEAVVSLGTAWMARSPALLAFGGDSAVELLSAAVVFWRFYSPSHREHGEEQAGRIAAVDETFHIMALGMLIGTLLIVDLRLLGFGMRRQSVAQVARTLAPWTLLSVALMIITGVLLFMSEAVRLSKSSPFLFKMIFLFCAVTLHFTLHRKAIASSTGQASGLGRLAATLSLMCWLGVALAGRAIAFL